MTKGQRDAAVKKRAASFQRAVKAYPVRPERLLCQLLDAKEAVARSVRILQGSGPLELGAADFHRALDALAAITGDEAGDDLLDAVFTRFCIGK